MPTLENVVVQSKSRNGKGIKIDDVWYGAFSAGQLAEVEYGDTITMTYTEKHPTPGATNTTVYLNIQGNPTVVSKASGAGPSVSATRTQVPQPTGFPVGPTSKDRSIVRQNSLGHAVRVMSSHGWEGAKTPQELAELVIDIARHFEAYSCGDVERMEAEQVLKDMQEG